MKYLIENGIEEVAKQSQQLAEKPRMMFLGYNADTKTVSCTYDQKSAADEIVAFICHPVDDEALQAIVSSCYEAAAIEREMKPTTTGAALDSEDLKRMFRENGFTEKNYSDLIMAVYLWKTYTARHLSSANGKNATLFMGLYRNQPPCRVSTVLDLRNRRSDDKGVQRKERCVVCDERLRPELRREP